MALAFASLYSPAPAPAPAPAHKKRNKSVSFALEDDSAAKRSKPAPAAPQPRLRPFGKQDKIKKKKRDSESEAPPAAGAGEVPQKKKKKKKKLAPETEAPPPAEEVPPKRKKIKKTERSAAASVADNLEGLSIGENANTIASLLDGMKVADKPKKHKKKKKNVEGGEEKENRDVKKKKSDPVNVETVEENDQVVKKKPKRKRKTSKTDSTQDTSKTNSTQDNSETEEIKEKVKWQKRKWNKERKGAVAGEDPASMIIVENLPIRLIVNYRKLLSEHFAKYGLIKKIGIVEVYPTEESRPVFTTTLQFDSEDAATQALGEDNMQFHGVRLRARRPLPATQTTIVVRSYRDCSQQSMSSIFAPCGKIRNIREVVKGGRTSMSTAFVEFDGPDAVDKALKVAEDARIGGKKIYVARFEERTGGKRTRRESGSKAKQDSDSDESDS